jgi:hypothetical protein
MVVDDIVSAKVSASQPTLSACLATGRCAWGISDAMGSARSTSVGFAISIVI